MGVSHQKIKSVGKDILSKGESLDKTILDTMKQISDIVGATLGPGGCPVLIERQEYGMPNLITKDGVTVFRSLGYQNPIAHAVMEAARDASVRTATEAGDGTTTATVLAYAFTKYTHEYLIAHPTESPQKVVRTLEKIFKDTIEPMIRSLAIKADDKLLKAVASCSANGDSELADAVMECFQLAGDDGNITILEKSGPSAYLVDSVKGYPLTSGYEDSCMRFFPVFINDKPNNRVFLEKPLFILNFGLISDIQQLFNLTGTIMDAWTNDPAKPHNVVLVATGFSETVLAHIASNWSNPQSINLYPLVLPQTPVQNGQLEMLQDLQGLTNSAIFDSITNPIERGTIENLGAPLEYFESHRYRSNVVGVASEEALNLRIDEVKKSLKSASSELDTRYIEERIGKLTGGIAKLTVVGASSGEIREKKDRADDAACAIRGTRRFGCLPGGGWTLLRLISHFLDGPQEGVIPEVLIPSLQEPISKLMGNIGLSKEEISKRVNTLMSLMESANGIHIWDGETDRIVEAMDSGIMDSVPAVLEAIRNSISIATLLGTLGGVVVFKRDAGLERQEAADTYEFLRNGGMVPTAGS